MTIHMLDLTPMNITTIADSASPLHVERGGRNFDHQSNDGVRWPIKLNTVI